MPTVKESRLTMRSGFRFLAVPLVVLATALSSDAAWAQFDPTIAIAPPSYCIPPTLSMGAAPVSATISRAGEADC